jgi:hypothetical protein
LNRDPPDLCLLSSWIIGVSHQRSAEHLLYAQVPGKVLGYCGSRDEKFIVKEKRGREKETSRERGRERVSPGLFALTTALTSGI